MKKVIFTSLMFVFLVSGAFAQDTVTVDTRTKVRVEVSGFSDNDQALKLITDETRRKAGGKWTIVRNNPKFILRCYASVEHMKSWRAVNNGAQLRNSLLDMGNRTSQAAVNRIPVNNQIVAELREGAKQGINNQFESRKHPVISQMEKYKGTVHLELVDAETGQVYAHGIGQNVIVVQKYSSYNYDGEPLVILVEGNLGATGIPAGSNLDGNMQQLLALSAFMLAGLPENNIVD